MKKVKILLVSILFVQSSYCQQNNVKIDNMYLLIGTLNDYMGRQITKTDNIVESYLGMEKHLVGFLDSILKQDYPDLTINDHPEIEKYHPQLELVSPLLRKKVDEFYNYKYNNSYRISGDSIFQGILKQEMLVTESHKLSFLVGVYLRFGVKHDSTYSIHISNSLCKSEICRDILSSLGCTSVEYFVYKDRIPNGNEVSFVPTETLRKLIDEYEVFKPN